MAIVTNCKFVSVILAAHPWMVFASGRPDIGQTIWEIANITFPPFTSVGITNAFSHFGRINSVPILVDLIKFRQLAAGDR